MNPPRVTDTPHSSFPGPVAVITNAPDADPRVFVGLSIAWLPYVLGALTQLCAAWTWGAPDVTDSGTSMGLARDLLSLFMQAPTGPTFPIELRITDTGAVQFSLDQGHSWGATGLHFAPPPGGFPFGMGSRLAVPSGGTALLNRPVFPYILNRRQGGTLANGPGGPGVLNASGGTALLNGPPASSMVTS